MIFLGTKSKKIETVSRGPRLIWRSRISLGSKTYEIGKTRLTGEHLGVGGRRGLTVRHQRKKNRLGVYQGSRKGKVRLSVTPCGSPCTDPEDLSPSKGLGVHSLFFREEEKDIEQQMY